MNIALQPPHGTMALASRMLLCKHMPYAAAAAASGWLTIGVEAHNTSAALVPATLAHGGDRVPDSGGGTLSQGEEVGPVVARGPGCGYMVYHVRTAGALLSAEQTANVRICRPHRTGCTLGLQLAAAHWLEGRPFLHLSNDSLQNSASLQLWAWGAALHQFATCTSTLQQLFQPASRCSCGNRMDLFTDTGHIYLQDLCLTASQQQTSKHYQLLGATAPQQTTIPASTHAHTCIHGLFHTATYTHSWTEMHGQQHHRHLLPLSGLVHIKSLHGY